MEAAGKLVVEQERGSLEVEVVLVIVDPECG